MSFTRTVPFFAALNQAHAISAFVAILVMGIGMSGIVYRAKGRLTLTEPSGALIVIAYVLGLLIVLMRS